MFYLIDLFNEDLISFLYYTVELFSKVFFYIKLSIEKKNKSVFFINIPTISLRKLNSIIFYVVHNMYIVNVEYR